MLIGRTASTLIAAHNVLATGVHGVGVNDVENDAHTHTLAEDVLGNAVSALAGTHTSTMAYRLLALAATTEMDIVSKSLTFVAGSRAVAVGMCSFRALSDNSACKLRLYMDGELIAESGFVDGDITYVVVGSKILTGVKTCKLSLYNYSGGEVTVTFSCSSGAATPVCAGIGIGSLKP